MSINITKKTTTHNTSAAANRGIKYIVVHYTAGVTSRLGSAANTAAYFGSAKQSSADFIVDDGAIVQYNPDIRNRYTWHCGGAKYATKGGSFYGRAKNSNSIGIEVCSNNDTGRMTDANDKHWSFTDATINNLVELVKYLMAAYGIDAAHVIRHYDVNGKPCPGIIGWNADTGSEAKWNAFKARLGAASGNAAPETGRRTPYTVKINTAVLNIRKGPGTGYATNGSIKGQGVYTIVDESTGPGASKWGQLKSGAGWISLDFCTKL